MSKNKKAREYLIICDSNGEIDGRVTVTDHKDGKKRVVTSGSIELTCTGNGYVAWVNDTRIELDYCEMADLLNAIDVLQLVDRKRGYIGLRASSTIFEASGKIV